MVEFSLSKFRWVFNCQALNYLESINPPVQDCIWICMPIELILYTQLSVLCTERWYLLELLFASPGPWDICNSSDWLHKSVCITWLQLVTTDPISVFYIRFCVKTFLPIQMSVWVCFCIGTFECNHLDKPNTKYWPPETRGDILQTELLDFPQAQIRVIDTSGGKPPGQT